MAALEYSVRFIILLIAVGVIASLILQFSSVSLPSGSKSASKDFPKTVQKAKFSEQEVAKYMADCYSALSSDKSLENDKVCYILDSSGNFEYLNEALILDEIKKTGADVNAEIIANYSYRPLIIIYERLKRLVVFTHRPRECYISMDCRQRPFEDCTRNVCYRGFCWYRAQCPNQGDCREGGQDFCNFCPHTNTETRCSDGIDNDCDGRIDNQDTDCGGGGGQCSARTDVCTSNPCCSGLECKRDVVGGTAPNRCCNNNECLRDNVCVFSGTTSGNQTCRNGEWVANDPSQCSNINQSCFFGQSCCSGLECKSGFIGPPQLCCRANDCYLGLKEACVPEGWIEGNMSCNRGTWGYNGTAKCSERYSYCGGIYPCCQGLACKQELFDAPPYSIRVTCCGENECYANGKCHAAGFVVANMTCVNGEWEALSQCVGKQLNCANIACCSGLTCKDDWYKDPYPKKCCGPRECLKGTECEPEGTNSYGLICRNGQWVR